MCRATLAGGAIGRTLPGAHTPNYFRDEPSVPNTHDRPSLRRTAVVKITHDR